MCTRRENEKRIVIKAEGDGICWKCPDWGDVADMEWCHAYTMSRDYYMVVRIDLHTIDCTTPLGQHLDPYALVRDP